MLARLKALFADSSAQRPEAAGGGDECRLAAAVLLVEAAQMQEPFTEVEAGVIRDVLRRRFGADEQEAEELLSEARAEQASASGLVRFTRTIKERFSPEQRVEVIEMLWEVVLADGVTHPYEASLLRRVAGLLYVPDLQVGAARKRVLRRLGMASGDGAGDDLEQQPPGAT